MINKPIVKVSCFTCLNEFPIEKEGFIDCPHCKNLKYAKFAPEDQVQAEADKMLSSVLIKL